MAGVVEESVLHVWLLLSACHCLKVRACHCWLHTAARDVTGAADAGVAVVVHGAVLVKFTVTTVVSDVTGGVKPGMLVQRCQRLLSWLLLPLWFLCALLNCECCVCSHCGAVRCCTCPMWCVLSDVAIAFNVHVVIWVALATCL